MGLVEGQSSTRSIIHIFVVSQSQCLLPPNYKSTYRFVRDTELICLVVLPFSLIFTDFKVRHNYFFTSKENNADMATGYIWRYRAIHVMMSAEAVSCTVFAVLHACNFK